MHYFPSTLNEIAIAVMQERDQAMKAGKTLRAITLGKFQMDMILREHPQKVPLNFKRPVVETFMGFPVKESSGWAFEVELK